MSKVARVRAERGPSQWRSPAAVHPRRSGFVYFRVEGSYAPYASTPSCSRVASPGSPRLRVSKVARVRAERGPGGAAPRPNARAAPASYTFVLRIRAQAVCVRPSRSLAASPGSPPCVCRKTHETCFSARGAAGGQHQSGLRKRDAEHRARDGRTTTTHKLSGSEKGRAAREGQGTAEGNQKNGAQR